MRRYKAIIIDGKKVARRGLAALCAAAVMLLAAVNVRLSGKNLSLLPITGEEAISGSIPAVFAAKNTGAAVAEQTLAALKKTVCFFLTFNPLDMRTAIITQIPIVKTTAQGGLFAMALGGAVEAYNPVNADKGEGTSDVSAPNGNKDYPIKSVDSSQGRALGAGNGKILIRNETDYSIDINEMLSSPLKFDMKGSGPKILIIHTHATECYSPEGAQTYSADKSDRSLNASENMISVGEAMKKVFEDSGIETIHDKTFHDHPNFNGSYANALNTIESYKAKYPSIRIVLDIHRDAYIYGDGQKAKFVTTVNGQKAAQLMLVVGTNAGGLDHPDWRENMKLALKLQKSISDKYPYLMRGVNLRKERFNGHTTHGSLIIEVGASGNTQNEAVCGAQKGAEAIAGFLNTLK